MYALDTALSTAHPRVREKLYRKNQYYRHRINSKLPTPIGAELKESRYVQDEINSTMPFVHLKCSVHCYIRILRNRARNLSNLNMRRKKTFLRILQTIAEVYDLHTTKGEVCDANWGTLTRKWNLKYSTTLKTCTQSKPKGKAYKVNEADAATAPQTQWTVLGVPRRQWHATCTTSNQPNKRD